LPKGCGIKRDRTEHYERLTHPLIREDGGLRRATWDEALQRAAEGFRRNVERNGPDAFAMLSCARSTNEMNYVAQKFADERLHRRAAGRPGSSLSPNSRRTSA
jgi:predicted molibdopterin-dependent oxidoreductase YjgC